MSESSSEVTASQHERFKALWNMLTPSGVQIKKVIVVNGNEGTPDLAVVRTLIEDINPTVLDERVIAVNRAPDKRVIECAFGGAVIRCSELGIILSGRSAYTANQLDTLERIIFSEDHIGMNDIPGMRP